MKKLAIYSALVVVFVLSDLAAHSGRTNAQGCHNNRKTGGYHCHGGSKSSAPSTSSSTSSNSNYNSKSTQPSSFYSSQPSAPPSAEYVAETEASYLIVQAQGLLKGLGFYDGKQDGTLNRETVSAVKAYQEFMLLPVDGLVTPEFVELLRADYRATKKP